MRIGSDFLRTLRHHSVHFSEADDKLSNLYITEEHSFSAMTVKLIGLHTGTNLCLVINELYCSVLDCIQLYL